jgi:hypothetical protein
MPKSKFEKNRFYFNENKAFPIEYFFIPVIIVGAIIGLWFMGKAISRSQGPAAAAEKVMDALKAGDGQTVAWYMNFTPEEDRRLDFGGGIEIYGNGVVSALKRTGWKIQNYKVTDVPPKDNKAVVPIKVFAKNETTGATTTIEMQLPL